MIFGSLDELYDLVRSGYALRTLYGVVNEDDPSFVSISKLEDFLGLLEIHEAEVRRLRQGLYLYMRQHVLESYLEDLRKRETALTVK